MLEEKKPVTNDLDWFHANLLAILAGPDAAGWSRTASCAFDEEDFGVPFSPQHGNDVFAAYQMRHSDGRLAQIEYDQEDGIFVDCEAIHWSGPLEDEVVGKAERQSRAQGRYRKNALNLTMERAPA